jgi:hypothetical protein
MPKFKNVSLTAIVLAAVAASLMIQHQSQAEFRANEALLQEQRSRLAALTAEHERLSSLVPRASGLPAEDHSAELARLRSAAEALKKQTNELGRTLAGSHDSQPSQPPPKLEHHTPEYYAQLHQMAGARNTDAMSLGRAFASYAFDHHQQCPASLDQLAPYLASENLTLSGTNQFEIIFQGSLDRLEGLPWGSVAVVREQQPWPGPDGKMRKVYGFPGGNAQMVQADYFQSWEAQHVIAPPADASGQQNAP